MKMEEKKCERGFCVREVFESTSVQEEREIV